jgi:hypothetical protein
MPVDHIGAAAGEKMEDYDSAHRIIYDPVSAVKETEIPS